MKEIKFRAWIDDSKTLEFIERIDFLSKLVLFCGKSTWNDYEYEDITIEQYTGLKDKYGVEIYEGDVVDVIISNIIGECCHVDKITVTDITDYSLIAMLDNSNEIKVIGNIHEVNE